ncbi:uncharacterized protein LOC130898139 [Diorhabda carinulata]|uniref:uncharacterized protein LOC130898139 n=1 Tax=Diorhabda carinulata TaxID=1163345 RepID=UPI00259FF5A3|nr:uncharacterized protein LOC130898139 [Diorhabda carinulata]
MSITGEIILEEIISSKEELKSLIEAVEVRLSLKIEDLYRKLNKVEAENRHLSNKIENIERKTKENNIVIFGLDTKPEEITPEYICNELGRLVNVTINESDLNNIYSLGRKERAPIRVEFVSYLKKSEVLKNAKNLKGTNISVANDLTLIQREEHKILRKHLILAKTNNHINCYIRRNKLFVDGKIYSPEELEVIETTEINRPKSNSEPATPKRDKAVANIPKIRSGQTPFIPKELATGSGKREEESSVGGKKINTRARTSSTQNIK